MGLGSEASVSQRSLGIRRGQAHAQWPDDAMELHCRRQALLLEPPQQPQQR